MTASTTSPSASYFEERFVLLTDPSPGTVVELAAGSQLAVRFRPPLGASRWHVADRPGHLLDLPLSEAGGHAFQFLVFGSPHGAAPVRFERRHPGRDIAHEVCELLVVPLTASVNATLSGTGCESSTG
jgi:hypothetical protein